MVNKEEVSPVELLHHVASMYSTQEIADEFGIAKSTVLRWLKGEVLPKPYISEHLHSMIASKVTAKSYRINEGDFTLSISSQVLEACVRASRWLEGSVFTQASGIHMPKEPTQRISPQKSV